MDNVKYRLKVEALSDFLTFTFNTTVANSKIDWGDGTVETYSSTGAHSHTYASAGEYIIESDDVRFNGGRNNTSNQHIEELEILNGVTTIGYYAFHNCYALTSLVIPDSVTFIDEYAFIDCKALTSLTIPDSVTNIKTGAFNNCNALTSLVIPDSVTTIGQNAFSGCKALTSLTLGNGLTSIPKEVFNDCKALTSLVIPDSVTSIGTRAFNNCNALTSLVIPDSVTTIGQNAFSQCNALTSLVIPNSVTSIDSYAFQNCSALTSLTISDSVTSIGNYAFDGCNALTSLTLGNGLTSIGNIFSGCKALISLVIPDSVTSIGSGAFSNCNALTSLVIPDSVTSISNSAFYGCYALTSLTLGNGLTSIGSNAFGSGAFTSVNYTGTQAEWNTLLPNIQDSKVKAATVNFIATIIYNSNGGSSVPSYTGSNYPNPLPVPTKDGYRLVGWFEESTFVTPVVAGAAITLGSHTIYAKWAEIEYEVYQKTDSGIVKLKLKGDKVVPNSSDPTTAKLTKLAINDTNFSLAGGGASVYADYSAMVTSINAMGSGALELGWNIYIRTVEVPDLWISKNDEATSVPYTYTTDAQFIEDLNTAAASGLQIGYFRVNKLETEKVFIPVEDVKINGTTILSGGVANIPGASSTSPGVVKSDPSLGTRMETGALGVVNADDSGIVAKKKYRVSGYGVISTDNIDKAVMEGLGNNSLNWSDAYKQSARNTIGIKPEMSFSCEMADGTTKTLKLYSELT